MGIQKEVLISQISSPKVLDEKMLLGLKTKKQFFENKIKESTNLIQKLQEAEEHIRKYKQLFPEMNETTIELRAIEAIANLVIFGKGLEALSIQLKVDVADMEDLLAGKDPMASKMSKKVEK